MVSYNKRAVHPAQKAERREVILGAALDCFQRPTFEQLTMAEVARAAGVSKGTLYLYFQSKEELFLQALLGLYGEWFQTFEPPPADLVQHVVTTLTARPKLLELMSMAPSVMEANAPLAAVLDFKRELAAGLERLSGLLEVEPRRLMWAYAVVVGLHCTTNTRAEVRESVPHFALDFATELRQILTKIL